MSNSKELDDLAVENFRNYLRIPSVHPNINYDGCVKFLKEQAASLGLPINVYEVIKGYPVVIITWRGSNPDTESILLNSHMDVVPVFEEDWNHPPFGADMDSQGNIYARGSQDMKCVGIQYLEAVRRLMQQGAKLKRTLHISFVPDEEIGGENGMKVFVNTQDFRDLKVGFALDEGMASPTPIFALFYGERSLWHVHLRCPGSAGHGSLLLKNTAGSKIRVLIDRFMDKRQREEDKLLNNPEFTVGDVTTINFTMVEGGKQANVVPPEMSVTFDIRIAIDVDHKELEKEIRGWMKEAGDGIEMSFIQRNPRIEATKLDKTNLYWSAMKRELNRLCLQVKPVIFPAATDSRYIRELGVPAIGFSPINNTPILLHDNDEYLNKKTFLDGIRIYENLLPAISNV